MSRTAKKISSKPSTIFDRRLEGLGEVWIERHANNTSELSAEIMADGSLRFTGLGYDVMICPEKAKAHEPVLIRQFPPLKIKSA